jgi:hypothetical protein
MISVPLPYDPQWTATLLRRDVRNLKTKVASRIKACFSPSPPSSLTSAKTATISVQENTDFFLVEAAEGPQDIESSVPAVRREVSHLTLTSFLSTLTY